MSSQAVVPIPNFVSALGTFEVAEPVLETFEAAGLALETFEVAGSGERRPWAVASLGNCIEWPASLLVMLAVESQSDSSHFGSSFAESMPLLIAVAS